ncbi:serine/threonine-protein phosphatase [Roseospira marina]|uniref:Serine/threonine-protein phosphatase n=1 Tax=Roseospira marina TaxID=140057 RepID=A0A5M6I9X1_9PROT|nr:protein phosphatase 2C domain-containing protein [Roseospira marina]KAA5604535.1 serine/threonine-protein phosphatase [Roseospira marina]MBB4315278.1 protein phosphatase/serine/threonine-protein phosphatase Stp1 [Roseospira marina]MBB5088277.1 protein phosphatase/serine/threonine-protein phosphatase Stp1 [Roseospira marina]
MNDGTQRIESASASHVGRVRSVNEDSYLERREIGLWAVADGMGGHSRGDLASRTVCQALSEIEHPGSGLDLLNAVRDALYNAHAQLLDHAAALGGEQTVGTTVVVLMICQEHYACVWAGDSRCYILREGSLTRLTHDHSVVQGMIDSGVLDESQAETHPLANVVTQALGAPGDLELATVHGPLEPGDLLLLCSDGLTRMVPDSVIAELLGSRGLAGVDTLIDAALSAGGRDNVTAVVVAPDGAGQGRGDHAPADDSLDEDDDTAIHWGNNGHG